MYFIVAVASYAAEPISCLSLVVPLSLDWISRQARSCHSLPASEPSSSRETTKEATKETTKEVTKEMTKEMKAPDRSGTAAQLCKQYCFGIARGDVYRLLWGVLFLGRGRGGGGGGVIFWLKGGHVRLTGCGTWC